MNQEAIWTYFQTSGVASFAHSRTQLEHLVRLAAAHTRNLPATPVMLNIGIGNAYIERAAAQRGWTMKALDISPEAVAALDIPGVEAHCGSITDMPFASASLDAVFCSEVLEHLGDADLAAAITELARVLKPEGLLLGTVPHEENLADSIVVCPDCGVRFHRWGHQQSFTVQRLRQCLTPQFLPRHTGVQFYSSRYPYGLRSMLVHWARTLLRKTGIAHGYANIVFTAQPAPHSTAKEP
ncbi:hypothetical protein JCM16814_03740 [Desulfobaculum senezii]